MTSGCVATLSDASLIALSLPVVQDPAKQAHPSLAQRFAQIYKVAVPLVTSVKSLSESDPEPEVGAAG